MSTAHKADAREQAIHSAAASPVHDVTRGSSPSAPAEPNTYEALVQSLPEGIALLDRERTLTSCNDAYVRITGYERSELTYLFSSQLVHQGDVKRVTAVLDDLVVAQRSSCTLEYRLRQKSGNWLWLETCASNMLDIPSVGALVLRTRDVTERKQSELHLNRMRSMLLESQRIAHFGSFEWVAETQETIWSDEEFRIYGLDPKDGSPDYETMLKHHIHPDDAELLDKTFRKAIANQEVYALEHRVVHPDGSVRIVQDVAHPYFDNDGRLYRYIGTTHDITDRRDLEAQLLQAQKIESMGQLAGGIAHDFNNILIPILGYTELAMDALPPDSELREYLEPVQHAATRAASLTRQILAFSRKQILQPRILDLNQIVGDFGTMARRLIGEDIELRTHLADELHLVNVDQAQIEQILLNLIVNARDAMPTGGQLTIETANIILDEAYVRKHPGVCSPGQYAMLAVSDSGCGMDEETQKRIFEPFFTTKEQGRGTGLGLATVFGIVEQHRGCIWVYSEPEKGTTFKVYLPRTEGAVESPDDVTFRAASGGGETILVVEDEALVRKLVCETLEAQGYRVLEARGPEEALRLITAEKTPIDLVFTDVIMPRMNGKELVRELRLVQPGLRAVFTSGYTDNVIVHHGILDKGVDFLQKPFTLHGLTTKVRQGLAPGG